MKVEQNMGRAVSSNMGRITHNRKEPRYDSTTKSIRIICHIAKKHAFKSRISEKFGPSPSKIRR